MRLFRLGSSNGARPCCKLGDSRSAGIGGAGSPGMPERDSGSGCASLPHSTQPGSGPRALGWPQNEGHWPLLLPGGVTPAEGHS